MNQDPSGRTRPTPAEIHRQEVNPEDDCPFFGRAKFNQEMLSLLDGIGQEPLVDFMDNIQRENKFAWNNSARILAKLSSDALFDNYGDDSLIWAALNGNSRDRHRHNLKLQETGYDLTILEKSQNWCQRSASNTLTSDVLAQYKLGSQLMSGELLHDIRLPDKLQQAARGDIKISDERSASYSLEPVMSAKRRQDGYAEYDGPVEGTWYENEPNMSYHVWLDAPFGLALKYKHRPQAIVSFSVAYDELVIHQFQGVKATPVNEKREVVGRERSSRGLALLDWQRLMVDVAAQVAENLGLERMAIQEARKNPWTQPYSADNRSISLLIKLYKFTIKLPSG